SEVLRHHLVGPIRLPNATPIGNKFREHRLNVEHRRTVQRVQPSNAKDQTVHTEHFTNRRRYSVRSRLTTLCEYADLRPRGIPARVPAARNDTCRIHLVQMKEHFYMGEFAQSIERTGGE